MLLNGGKVRNMGKGKQKNKKKNYPSLYDAFELGDRVMRIYQDKNGKKSEYKGVVLAIDDNCMEIYWDTRDGQYRPKGMGIAFTNCETPEIFKGNDKYSPIQKDSN